MTTYNTGNPIGSADPRDLYDNAENIDDAVNGDGKTWLDRLGRARVSMRGVEEAVPDAIAARDAAVLARDAAIAAAGPLYATEADGRAAVADGETFNVQGSGDVAASVYRRVNASASTLIAQYPSKGAIDSLDSLWVNKGKGFPLRQFTRGGITSPINTAFADFLLSVEVIGGDPTKTYQFSQFTNGFDGLADRWMINEYTNADFLSGAAGATIRFTADAAPAIDRSLRIQKITLTTRTPGLLFVVTVSPISLPSYGTRLNVQVSSQNGYSWAVDPACYVSTEEKDALTFDTDADVADLRADLNATSDDVDLLFNALENRQNRIQWAIKDPFQAVRIRLIGDSITWGRTASNNSATDPRTGYLTDPRNTTSASSPTWANLLRNWILQSYGDGVSTEDAPGSTTFSVPVECAILSDNKHRVSWLKSGVPFDVSGLNIITSASPKTGRYLDISTAVNAPDGFEFETNLSAFDVYCAGLSDRPQEQRQVDVYVDGVFKESFFAYAATATWNLKHTVSLDGQKHLIRVVLAPSASSARIIGVTASKTYRIANDGIIGSSFNTWLARNLIEDSVAADDTHAFVQLGTNDRSQSGASVDKLSADVALFVNRLKAENPNINVSLLVANAVTQDESVEPFKFKMRDVDMVLRRASEFYKFGFLSQFTETMHAKIDGTSFLADGLHPNDYGHKLMFENIIDKWFK